MMTNLSNIWQPNYIDCIRWAGDMLLAKSIHNKVVLMESIPGLRRETMRLRHDFSVTACGIWYLRFAVDPSQQWLALGNMQGVTCVWSIDDAVLKQPVLRLQHAKVNATIRHCAFALDNRYLLTSTDDARVVVWNIERSAKAAAASGAEAP
jgi:WD40 repeat protein